MPPKRHRYKYVPVSELSDSARQQRQDNRKRKYARDKFAFQSLSPDDQELAKQLRTLVRHRSKINVRLGRTTNPSLQSHYQDTLKSDDVLIDNLKKKLGDKASTKYVHDKLKAMPTESIPHGLTAERNPTGWQWGGKLRENVLTIWDEKAHKYIYLPYVEKDDPLRVEYLKAKKYRHSAFRRTLTDDEDKRLYYQRMLTDKDKLVQDLQQQLIAKNEELKLASSQKTSADTSEQPISTDTLPLTENPLTTVQSSEPMPQQLPSVEPPPPQNIPTDNMIIMDHPQVEAPQPMDRALSGGEVYDFFKTI